MICKMVWVAINEKMGLLILANTKTISKKELESIFGKTKPLILALGRLINFMGLDFTVDQMGKSIWANGVMDLCTDMEYLSIETEKGTMVNGFREESMEEVRVYSQMDRKQVVIGYTEKFKMERN